jgi:hypothetical protein
MEVKIYREKENEILIMDEQELISYNQLAEELGIKPKKQDDIQNCPIVYPILNEAMQRQLKALCPSSTDLKEYTRSTIPVEILRVCKFCIDNEMFDDIKVWFDDKQLDPLIIGYKWRSEEDKQKGYSWNKNKYLIARWGDCAKEIPELLSDGFERVKQQLLDKAVEVNEKVKSIIANPDIYARKIVNGQSSDMNVDLYTDGNSIF